MKAVFFVCVVQTATGVVFICFINPIVVVLGLHGGHVSSSVLAGQSVSTQLQPGSHAGLQPREGPVGTRYLLLQRKAGMYIELIFLSVFLVLVFCHQFSSNLSHVSLWKLLCNAFTFDYKRFWTRMHSSRMHTARTLTVVPVCIAGVLLVVLSRRGGWWSCPGVGWWSCAGGCTWPLTTTHPHCDHVTYPMMHLVSHIHQSWTDKCLWKHSSFCMVICRLKNMMWRCPTFTTRSSVMGLCCTARGSPVSSRASWSFTATPWTPRDVSSA